MQKFHPKPQSKSKFVHFENKDGDRHIELNGETWSWLSMGDHTYVRPPSLDGTWEVGYYDVQRSSPPQGCPCPPPDADKVEQYIKEHLIAANATRCENSKAG
jgi:hypothetical protein